MRYEKLTRDERIEIIESWLESGKLSEVSRQRNVSSYLVKKVIENSIKVEELEKDELFELVDKDVYTFLYLKRVHITDIAKLSVCNVKELKELQYISQLKERALIILLTKNKVKAKPKAKKPEVVVGEIVMTPEVLETIMDIVEPKSKPRKTKDKVCVEVDTQDSVKKPRKSKKVIEFTDHVSVGTDSELTEVSKKVNRRKVTK